MPEVMSNIKIKNINFTDGDIKGALNMMQDDNQVMLSDETVFLI